MIRPLAPEMGQDILRLFRQMGELHGIEDGLVAGQSVCSALLRLWGRDGRQGPINDIDVFEPDLDPRASAIDFKEFQFHGVVTSTDTKKNRERKARVASSDYLIPPLVPGLIAIQHYQITDIVSQGLTQRIGITPSVSYPSNRVHPLDVLLDFDLNCVQVAVDIKTGKLWWTPAFERFVATGELALVHVHSGIGTIARTYKKAQEMPWVKCDLDSVVSSCLLAMHTSSAKTMVARVNKEKLEKWAPPTIRQLFSFVPSGTGFIATRSQDHTRQYHEAMAPALPILALRAKADAEDRLAFVRSCAPRLVRALRNPSSQQELITRQAVQAARASLNTEAQRAQFLRCLHETRDPVVDATVLAQLARATTELAQTQPNLAKYLSHLPSGIQQRFIEQVQHEDPKGLQRIERGEAGCMLGGAPVSAFLDPAVREKIVRIKAEEERFLAKQPDPNEEFSSLHIRIRNSLHLASKIEIDEVDARGESRNIGFIVNTVLNHITDPKRLYKNRQELLGIFTPEDPVGIFTNRSQGTPVAHTIAPEVLEKVPANVRKWTAIAQAVGRGDEVFQALCDAIHTISDKDLVYSLMKGVRPLTQADMVKLYESSFDGSRSALLKTLLRDGLSPNARMYSDSENVPLLVEAARNGYPDVCSILIEAGADLDEMTPIYETALDVAVGGALDVLRAASARRVAQSEMQSILAELAP